MVEDLNSLARLLISPVPKERQQGIVLAVRGNHSRLANKIAELAGSDPDQETRYLARKGLERLGTDEKEAVAIEDQFVAIDIEKLLQAEDPKARFAGLKKILVEKSKTGRFMLLSALADEQLVQLKASMIIGIGHFRNSEDVPFMAQFLKHEDSRIRANCVEALAMIASEEAYRVIVSAMGDSDNRVKANVVKALQEIGGPSLFELLKKMSQDDCVWMRSSAVFAFSKIKSPQSLVALAKVAQNDPEMSIRSSALTVIKKEKEAGNPAAALILSKLQQSAPEKGVDTGPVVTQEEFEPGSDGEMLTLLNSNEPTKRYIALAQLAAGEFFKFADNFMAVFSKEQDAFLVSMMLTILREKKLAVAFPRVRVFLTHNDDRVRANAVEALAAIDMTQASESLVPMLLDKNSRVVANAIIGLYPSRKIDVATEVKLMLKQGREAFKHSALYVLSIIREPYALPLLEKLLADYSPRVRDKAYSILSLYANDRVTGSMRLQQEVEKQITLEKNREHFFENSLDKTFASLLKLIKSGDKLEGEQEKKLFERNPQSEKLAILQLADKCLQHNLFDDRSLEAVHAIDLELQAIGELIEKSRMRPDESTVPVEECVKNMSEEQLLSIERKSLLARREATMSFFAFDFYGRRFQLDSQVTALMRVELGRVEGSLCSFVPEKRFSMLPYDNAVVSEIFDVTMRLYQKHVYKFSMVTLRAFFRWVVLASVFTVGLLVFSHLFLPIALAYAIVFTPYLAYKTLGYMVEWKIKIALMVHGYIHGNELADDSLHEKSGKQFKNVMGVAIKKNLLLGLWLVIAFFISGTIISAGAVAGEFNLLSSLANMVGALIAVFIFSSVYFKYLLVEPAAILVPDKDPFATAEDIYRKDRVKIWALFIFATFVMAIVTDTSKQVLVLLMPVLPAKISTFLVIGLTVVSDLCLLPIVFSTIVIFVLMRLRKVGLS